MLVPRHHLHIPLLGLWLLCSLITSQEICSSPGTLPAPWLFLNRLSARPGDTVMLSCLVPSDTPMTRIAFCKDGKEISVQPKEGNKRVYDSSHIVAGESAGIFSCLYQLKDDKNQANNSAPSDAWYLRVADGDSPAEEASPQGPAIPLWVWILRFTLVLLLLASTPIIGCTLRERGAVPPTQKALEGSGREEEEKEVAKGSGGLPCLGKPGGSAGVTERSVDYIPVQKQAHRIQRE